MRPACEGPGGPPWEQRWRPRFHNCPSPSGGLSWGTRLHRPYYTGRGARGGRHFQGDTACGLDPDPLAGAWDKASVFSLSVQGEFPSSPAPPPQNVMRLQAEVAGIPRS